MSRSAQHRVARHGRAHVLLRGVGAVFALSGSFIVGGSGVADALQLPSLPVSVTNLPSSLVKAGGPVGAMLEAAGSEVGVVAAAEGLTGAAAAALTAAETAAAVGAAGAAAGTAAVAGAAILGTGAALVGYWKLGNLVGQSLPCLDCPPASGGTGPSVGGADPAWSPGRVFNTNYQYQGTDYNPVTVTLGYADPKPAYGMTVGSVTLSAMPSVPGQSASVDVTVWQDVVCRAPATGFFEQALHIYGNSGSVSGSMNVGAVCASTGLDYMAVRFNTGAIVARYYAPGSPNAPAPVASGPSGKPLQATSLAHCTAPAGGAVSSIVGTSASFLAADPTFPPVPYPACPPGTFRTDVAVTVAPVDGSSAAQKLWGTTGVVGSVGTGTGIGPDGQPLAAPGVGPLIGTYSLTLSRVLSDGTSRAYDPAVDRDLANDPVEGPRNFRCQMGPQLLALSECSAIFTQLPIHPPTTTSNCDGSGFSFNPVSWVIVPLKCLFIPSAGTMQAAYGTVGAGWSGTHIPQWGSAVGSIGTALTGFGGPGSSGCAGPHFAFTLKGHAYSFDPLNACSQPMQGVAVVVKLFATIAVVVAGARLCARPLMAAIGMGQAV